MIRDHRGDEQQLSAGLCESMMAVEREAGEHSAADRFRAIDRYCVPLRIIRIATAAFGGERHLP